MKLSQGSGNSLRPSELSVLSKGCHSRSGHSSASTLPYLPTALMKKSQTPPGASQCAPGSSLADLCDLTQLPAVPAAPSQLQPRWPPFFFSTNQVCSCLRASTFCSPEYSAPGRLLTYVPVMSPHRGLPHTHSSSGHPVLFLHSTYHYLK